MPTYLNDLILSASDKDTANRNEIIAAIDPKKKGIEGITITEVKTRNPLARIFKPKEVNRVIVRTARAVDVSDIRVENEDVSTDIKYRITLKLTLEVPEADDTDSLKRLVQAFQGASLERYGERSSDQQPALGPQRMFETEIKQWIQRRYKSGQTISDHNDPAWQKRQADDIQLHILKEYGLIALARLSVEFASPIELGPIDFAVKSCAKDSPKEIVMNLRAGCRLHGEDPFAASPLSEDNFKKHISSIINRYLRDHVSLHSFRFETEWFAELRSQIEKSLGTLGREATDLHYDYIRNNGGYRQKDYSISAKDAKFVPAGWDPADAILFSARADMEIADAAIFEDTLTESDLSKIEETLTKWLEDAMQTAVENCLHEVHKSKNGYSHLLANWSSKFRGKIESKLKSMAAESGITANTIVTQPDRPEMNLLKKAEIRLDDLSLPLKQDAGTIELFGSVEVSAHSFEDEKLKDILNASKTPLDYIRDKIILPTLSKSSRKIDYNTFNKAFEAEVIETFEKDLKEVLSNDHNLKLEMVELQAKETPQQLVLKRLLAAPSQEVTFQVPRLHTVVDGETQVSPAFNISFQLQISGVEFNNHIDRFLNYDWTEQVKSSGSEYSSIVKRLGDSLGKELTTEDIPILMYANSVDALVRKDFEERIKAVLDAYLTREYGLTGEALAVEAVIQDNEAILEEEEDAMTRIAIIKAKGAATREEIEAGANARKQLTINQAEDQVKENRYNDKIDATDLDRFIGKKQKKPGYAAFPLPKRRGQGDGAQDTNDDDNA